MIFFNSMKKITLREEHIYFLFREEEGGRMGKQLSLQRVLHLLKLFCSQKIWDFFKVHSPNCFCLRESKTDSQISLIVLTITQAL